MNAALAMFREMLRKLNSVRPLFRLGHRVAPLPPSRCPSASATGVGSTRWNAEVDAMGTRLLISFGPFLVRGGDKKVRRPLVDLDAVLDAARASAPMAVRLATCDASFDYVVWASRRLGVESCTAAQAAAAERLRARHGLPEPLHLAAGTRSKHAWAADASWVLEFSRGGSFSRRDGARGREESAAIVQGTSGRFKRGRHSPDGRADPEERKQRRRSLPAAVRMAVWNRWVGYELGVGPCHCCGRKIAQQDFECGHVVAAACGGADTVDNLRPLCRTCNRSMGTRDMREFKLATMGGVESPP